MKTLPASGEVTTSNAHPTSGRGSSDPVRDWQQQVVRRVPESRANVLVVEDDPITRDGLVALVRAMGYSAAAVSHGQFALTHIRLHGPPELILLDLRMPGMTGWAFRLELERDPALAEIPIVVCSGHWNARVEARSLKAVDVLTKPVEAERLLAILQRHCRSLSSVAAAPAALAGDS